MFEVFQSGEKEYLDNQRTRRGCEGGGRFQASGARVEMLELVADENRACASVATHPSSVALAEVLARRFTG